MSKYSPLGIFIAIAVFGAMLLQTSESRGSQPRMQNNPLITQWLPLLPSIEKLFKEQGIRFPEYLMREDVVDAADFATPGISIILVDCGGAGAYTDSIFAVRRQNGNLALARFLQPDGKLGSGDFIQGASVLHSADVRLVPSQSAVYDTRCDTNGETSVKRCSILAYVWNERTSVFEWNRKLSDQATANYSSKRSARSMH